jgi:hypothetical protein
MPRRIRAGCPWDRPVARAPLGGGARALDAFKEWFLIWLPKLKKEAGEG